MRHGHYRPLGARLMEDRFPRIKAANLQPASPLADCEAASQRGFRSIGRAAG